MNNFKNPLVPLIVQPVNLDRPIQELQQQLAALGWLEKVFGRAYESIKQKTGSGKPSIYPEVWQGKDKDLLEVLPNDNLKSQSFFKVDEPITVSEYISDGYSTMRAPVALIVWFNLREIDPDIDYRYIELLKGQVQRAITNSLLTSAEIKILRSWETAAQVFKGYDINHLAQQELVHPYGGFRFDLEITYIEDCPDGVYDVPQD